MTMISGALRRAPPLGLILAMLIFVAASALTWRALNEPIATGALHVTQGQASDSDISNDAADRISEAPDVAETYTETLQRPLFFAGRQPPGREPEIKPKQAEKAVAQKIERPARSLPPGLELVGIVNTGRDGQGPRALIRSAARPTGKWFVTGAEIGDWQIARISGSSVTIEADGERRVLRLFQGRGG